jgi:hypothetical protein
MQPDATSKELRWFKSSYSGGSSSDCVEAAIPGASIYVRDSKAPDSGRLSFTAEAWTAFLADVTAGRFDLD